MPFFASHLCHAGPELAAQDRSCAPAVFAELMDGASLVFFDRVVVLAVLPQRQVVDIPVMEQLQVLLDCLPLRFPSCIH